MASQKIKGNTEVVDLAAHPTAMKMVQRCEEFFAEIKNLTPGKALEEKLNAEYGPGSPFYEDFKRYTLQGVEEGWVANEEIDGPTYRRSKICNPSADTSYFSIHTVYMDSGHDLDSDKVFQGQYHLHPYGELNCVIPVDEGALLLGMQGWQGPGWTSPGPGTHHYPTTKGGRMINLFFLPASRISYAAKPSDPQPASL